MRLPCLSVQQPWAWAILAGRKPVENRTWLTRHRGLLAIHASRSTTALDATPLEAPTPEASGGRPDGKPAGAGPIVGGISGPVSSTASGPMSASVAARCWEDLVPGLRRAPVLWFGAVVGAVELRDVCRARDLPPAERDHPLTLRGEDNWCWRVGGARVLKRPIPYRGYAALFQVELPDDPAEWETAPLLPEPPYRRPNFAEVVAAVEAAGSRLTPADAAWVAGRTGMSPAEVGQRIALLRAEGVLLAAAGKGDPVKATPSRRRKPASGPPAHRVEVPMPTGHLLYGPAPAPAGVPR